MGFQRMQHFYNGYLPSINCGTSSSSSSASSFAASNRIANTGSSPNISLSNDLNPYLQQTLNKLPVALNPNLPYLQHSMIAFANRIPYQTTPEVQTNNPNLTELLESIGSDFRLDQNKSNEEELISSGYNGGLSEELNPTDFTELSSSGSSTVSSSSMTDAFPTSQSSSSLIQTIDEEHLTGIIKTTISDSSVQKPLQTKRERAVRTSKNKLSGSSSHGGVGASSSSNSGGISAQDLDKAISLTNKGFRSLSLKGIYYDRRNHGWQVRIRKRQTEISRYFSAKRYGVEKSYEMALRFYQVNIIGNFGNDSKSARNSENSRRLDGKSDNQVSPILSKDGQNELFERQISGQKSLESQITDSASVNGTNIFKNISSNSRICNNSIDGSFKPLNTDSVPLNGNLNNLLSFPSQGDLDVNSQLLSHYITNNILNNILVNQIIANNLFASTMMNVRNAVNLQGTTGLPIHCFSKVATPQPPAQQYGTNFTTCVNSPNIVPSTPIINPSMGIVSYNNDSQLMLKDIISNALSDSEGLWKGIYYDNRNKGWKLCLDGYAEKFFGSMEFGEIESLTLVLACKLNVFKFNCDVSQIRPTISNSIAVLQKVMAINNEAYHESPLSDGKSFIEDEGKKTAKNLLDSTLREKMDSFSLTELTEFISVSQQIKQIINNGVLRSGYQTLSSINYNEGIPFVQPMTADNLKHSLNFRQPSLNNFFDSSAFLQSVNNNQSLLYGQFLLNNQNQFGML